MTIAKDVSQSIADTTKAINKVTAAQTAVNNALADFAAALADLQVVAADLQDIQNDITPVPVSPPPPPPPPAPPPPPTTTSAGFGLDTSTFLYKQELLQVTPQPQATVPAVGVSWIDPLSGAPMERISNYADMPGAPSDLTGVCSDYSRFPIFSHDKAFMYANGVGGNEVAWLYRLSDKSWIGPLKGANGSLLGENNLIRWDNSGNRDHVFYYVTNQGMQLYEYDVDTATSTLIRDFTADFPGCQQITNGVEGDVSLDGATFVFMAQKYTGGYWTTPYIFTYNRVSNTILGKLANTITSAENSSPNMVDMWPDASGCVIDWGPKQGTAPDQNGAHFYPLNLDPTKAVRIGNGEEHSGFGMNTAGEWVFVSQDNTTDNIIACTKTGGYNGPDMIVLQNLANFGYKENGDIHFIKLAVPGFVGMVTAHTADAQPGDNQLLFLPIAPMATPKYMCQTMNIETPAYYTQAFWSATLDGLLAAGASNYESEEGTHLDMFGVQFPADWSTHAPGA